ncbi:hypothetical protein RRG08_052373 [Elysia crispata]|uniref:G-protein coupled receptors family 1 profile domain-containing protein n=1 Tax=Elysia crispata TaxID=231223 RepID=A0AAE1A6A9_9GAST|nr:hypothetical protein RRG08_052373 [Elysia crispata]
MREMTMESFNLNDSLSLDSTPAPDRPGQILYISAFYKTLQILFYAWPSIILFGFVANITNIVVFLKVGAKDNVTILLISLSLSDLAFLALITPSVCGYIIQGLLKFQWPFHDHLLKFTLYWPAFTAYDLSAFISVSLGAMRCACVAMPLKFKLVFTKSRTIKWVFFLVVLAVSLRMPVLTIFRITWRTDPMTNVSSLYLASVNKASMSRINDILNRGVVIWFNYVTMITCVIVLSYNLYQSSKMRQSLAVKGPRPSDQGSATGTATAQSMSAKDLQVVKSVVLVCSIFIMSQLPFVMLSTTRLVVPEFAESGGLELLFGIFSQVNSTLAYLNASINIFVYYNYNSKYRSVLRSVFSGKEERDLKTKTKKEENKT